MIPPPASKIRSARPSAAQVAWTCRANRPEEKTGIATAGGAADNGASIARAEAIALSSPSQNLLAIPLTCR